MKNNNNNRAKTGKKSGRRSKQGQQVGSRGGLTPSPQRVSFPLRFGPQYSPVPPVVRSTLRYNAFTTMASAAGAPSIHSWRLNSLYDPDYSSTGALPVWYSWIAAVYGSYRVLGARVTIVFSNTVTTDEVRIGILATGNASASVPSTPEIVASNVGGRLLCLGSSEGGSGMKKVTLTYLLPSLFGTNMDFYRANGGYTASFNNNPTNVSFLHTVALCDNQNYTVRQNISMEMDCEFFNPLTGNN